MDYKIIKPSVVFIGGTGRCGTNILAKMISQHPQVGSLPFEYRFLIDPDGIIDFYNTFNASWSPYMADVRIKRLEKLFNNVGRKTLINRTISKVLLKFDRKGMFLSPEKYAAWELEKHIPCFMGYVKDLIDSLRQFSYRGCWPGTESFAFKNAIYYSSPKEREELKQLLVNFIQRCICSILKNQQKTMFLEDNTWNILFASNLLALVPDAKLIHVYRDPRDVVASLRQQRWAPDQLENAVMFYTDIMSRWQEQKNTLPLNSYLEVKFEDVVMQTRNVKKGLSDFIGLDFYDYFNGDLSRHNIGRWQRDFSKKEQDMVNQSLKIIIKTLGYHDE